MNSSLIKFHLSCKKEHSKLLEEFNILYYGFGCKKSLLLKMYPKALHFDMNYYKISDILLELNKKYKTTHTKLSDFNVKNTLVLIDFDFKYSHHFISSSFNLIFTLERCNREVSFKGLNIIMRDLTTYIDYNIDYVESKENKLEGYLNVIRNGSKNSKLAFKTLLEFKDKIVPVNKLFDKIKKSLMIIKKNLIFNYLSQFIDHDMLKIKDHQNIEVIVEEKYYKDLVEECNK